MIIEFFKEYPEIKAGITKRNFGNCSNNMETKKLEICHKRIKNLYGMKSLIPAQLVHKDTILNIEDNNYKQNADGLVTNIPNYLIAVTTADCIPVFLYDPTTLSIGIVHSGRMGLKEKITNKCIKKMKNDFNISLKDLQIQIGPHICQKCYEVESDILKEFNIISSQKGGLPMQDILIQDLLSIEIPIKNIRTTQYCTLCSKNSDNSSMFFSYRNNKEMERMLSFIGINSF